MFVLPVGTHPSARISRAISFDVIGICVLLAQLLYQKIRVYVIRIDAKRINKKKEVNPNVIKLRNDGFEENTKNVLLFFLWKI